MPNVRASSGMIGTTRLPISGFFSSSVSMRTNAIVVEGCGAFGAVQQLGKGIERRRLNLARRNYALRHVTAELPATLVQVRHLRAALGRPVERNILRDIFGKLNVEPLPEQAAPRGRSALSVDAWGCALRSPPRRNPSPSSPGSPSAARCAPPRLCKRCRLSADRARRGADGTSGHR